MSWPHTDCGWGDPTKLCSKCWVCIRMEWAGATYTCVPFLSIDLHVWLRWLSSFGGTGGRAYCGGGGQRAGGSSPAGPGRSAPSASCVHCSRSSHTQSAMTVSGNKHSYFKPTSSPKPSKDLGVHAVSCPVFCQPHWLNMTWKPGTECLFFNANYWTWVKDWHCMFVFLSKLLDASQRLKLTQIRTYVHRRKPNTHWGWLASEQRVQRLSKYMNIYHHHIFFLQQI